MNRFVVFTVNVGNYDEVRQPLVIDDRFDYVLFSDTHKEDTLGVWKVRSIPYESNKKHIKARYPRLQPEKVLGEYEAWLYIDGKLQLTSSDVYERCIKAYEQGYEWCGCNHECRNSLYEEMSTIILDRQFGIHDYECIQWYYFLKSQHYPDRDHLIDNFLYETSVIFRRKSDNVRKVNDIWWWSIEQECVKRDQFSLMYAIWKVPELRKGFILPPNVDVLHNESYFIHHKHIGKREYRPFGIWEHMRYRIWKSSHKKDDLYVSIFDEAYGISKNHPRLALDLWTIRALLLYGYKVIYEIIMRRLYRLFH